MHIHQFILLSMILTAMLLSGCSRSQNIPHPTAEAAIITEFTAPETDLAGTWKLDGEKTEKGLKNSDSLLSLYGTGIHEGAELVLKEDGTIRYFIGINNGGEGTYTVDDGTILAEVNPFTADSLTTFPLTLQLLEEDGIAYLVMEDFGESIYWTK